MACWGIMSTCASIKIYTMYDDFSETWHKELMVPNTGRLEHPTETSAREVAVSSCLQENTFIISNHVVVDTVVRCRKHGGSGGWHLLYSPENWGVGLTVVTCINWSMQQNSREASYCSWRYVFFLERTQHYEIYSWLKIIPGCLVVISDRLSCRANG